MFSVVKIVHVLAVGLWFGAGLFFTFAVAPLLFITFEKETATPPAERPFWLPAPPELEKSAKDPMFPAPLRKEQGSRIAGTAVGPIFFPYYILQAVCGALCLLTALVWYGAGALHRRRVVVLLLALAGVAAGWWIEREVEALRTKRAEARDVFLKSDAPSAEQEVAARDAWVEFAVWHNRSLTANFSTLALVTVAMGMAAFLPAPPASAGHKTD
jgi:hypothetical protein